MIDLHKFRDNPELYIQWAQKKWISLDWDAFSRLDDAIRELKTEHQELLHQKKQLSEQVWQLQQSWKKFDHIVEEVKWLKSTIQTIEDDLNDKQDVFDALLLEIPNPPAQEVPEWKTDEENVVLDFVGAKPDFWFTPQTHRDLLEKKGYLDQERAVKISWSRFQIVRWPLARLQFALIHRVVDKLTKKWFEFTLVPQLVQDHALQTTWFLPNDSTNLYRVNPKSPTQQDDREEDDLWLAWTAEVSLVAQHTNEVFLEDQLPKRYVWFSSCYRREAGTYGKDTKWLIRLHQFEKVEMVSFVHPDNSVDEHDYLLSCEEEIYKDLGIPYNRMLICGGDLWAPASKKYDLEAWFPWMDMFKEITSTSNTTDFQTRRGNIKLKTSDNKKIYPHALNGTAIALGRVLAAIVENYQTQDGDIRIPEALQSLMHCEKI